MLIILRSYKGVIFFLALFAFFAWLTVRNDAHLTHSAERAFNAFGTVMFAGYLLYILRK